jgi:hypothetical protein
MPRPPPSPRRKFSVLRIACETYTDFVPPATSESYLYFDPRSTNARGMPVSQSRNQQNSTSRGIEATFGQKRQGFAEAIVFPVGKFLLFLYMHVRRYTDFVPQVAAPWTSTVTCRNGQSGQALLVQDRSVGLCMDLRRCTLLRTSLIMSWYRWGRRARKLLTKMTRMLRWHDVSRQCGSVAEHRYMSYHTRHTCISSNATGATYAGCSGLTRFINVHIASRLLTPSSIHSPWL